MMIQSKGRRVNEFSQHHTQRRVDNIAHFEHYESDSEPEDDTTTEPDSVHPDTNERAERSRDADGKFSQSTNRTMGRQHSASKPQCRIICGGKWIHVVGVGTTEPCRKYELPNTSKTAGQSLSSS